MKRLWTIILLLSLMTLGYSQQTCEESPGVLLGKTYNQVKFVYNQYNNYKLIESSDTSLTYWDRKQDYTATYIFKQYKGKRYCAISTIKTDCLSGEELIGSHNEDWECIDFNTWLYTTTAYDIPLTVVLSYVDGFMLFTYRYIPDYKLTGH